MNITICIVIAVINLVCCYGAESAGRVEAEWSYFIVAQMWLIAGFICHRIDAKNTANNGISQ